MAGVKLKYHKIRGVDKTVCTVEQLIAYKFAFAHCSDYRNTWRKSADQYARFQQVEFIAEAVAWCMRMISYCPEITGKYNIDAIQSALYAGMENYFNGNSVLWSYEEVGKTFPAYYL